MLKTIDKKINDYNKKIINKIEFNIGSEEYNSFYSLTYRYIQVYSNELWLTSIKSIKESQFLDSIFSEEEKRVLLVINKIIFENLFSFFELLKINYFNSGVNNLRAFMENFRLAILFLQDDIFRKDYIINNNFEFSSKKDRQFIQSKVSKKLEQINNELKEKKEIPISLKLSNNHYTKNSAFSRLHSKLSKLCHITNVNLMKDFNIIDNRIDCYQSKKFNSSVQLQIKVCIECLLDVLPTYRLWITSNHYADYVHQPYFSLEEQYFMDEKNIEYSF